MAKYLTVISDSHGARRNLSRLIGDFSISDKIVFLGDGLSDLNELFEFQDKIIAVSGNCDFSTSKPKQVVFEVEGLKFLAVHGDMFGVKLSLSRLKAYAKSIGVNAVLFGHTHKAIAIEDDGVWFINPGTLSHYGDRETFAFITVKNAKITAKIIPISTR